MLAIRMQRTGRKGHAMFRVVVQESRRTPTSGNVVTLLGNYDPHTKAIVLDKEKAAFYLGHGAQPSPRAARLLQAEGVKLPKWVTLSEKKQGTLRNADKLRRNQKATEEKPATAAEPAQPKAEEPSVEAAAEPVSAETAEATENSPESGEKAE
jgi:small subunit ribosomal protein S16